MTLRTKSRVDENQPEIVKGLKACGYSVLHIHVLKNCFDILVGAYGLHFAFEIKNPKHPPSKKKLTDGEQKFFDTWRGQVDVIETFDDAFEIINRRLKRTI